MPPRWLIVTVVVLLAVSAVLEILIRTMLD